MPRRVVVTLAVAGMVVVAVILLLTPQGGDLLPRLPVALGAGVIAAIFAWWSLADDC